MDDVGWVMGMGLWDEGYALDPANAAYGRSGIYDPIGFGASADFPTFTRNTDPYPDRQVGYSGVLDSRYPFDHDLGQADPRMVDRRYRELLPDLGPRGEWPQGNTDYAAAAGRASFGEAMRRIGVGSMGGLPPTRRGEGGHAGGGG